MKNPSVYACSVLCELAFASFNEPLQHLFGDALMLLRRETLGL